MSKHKELPEKTLFEDIDAIVRAYIREHKQRYTSERKVIVQQICSYDCAFTAKQLVADICEKEYISRATIYNTLEFLQECRLLTKIEAHLGNSQDEYELKDPRVHKVHYVCTDCGRVGFVKDKAIEDILRRIHISNFVVDSYSLRVYGQCRKCKKKGLKQ